MALKENVENFYENLFDILDHGYLENENTEEVLKSVDVKSGGRYPEPSHTNTQDSIQDYTAAASEIQAEMVERMIENGSNDSELKLLEGNFRDIMQETLETNGYNHNGFYRREELFQSGRLMTIVPDYLNLEMDPPPRLNPYKAIHDRDPQYEKILFETAEDIAYEISPAIGETKTVK